MRDPILASSTVEHAWICQGLNMYANKLLRVTLPLPQGLRQHLNDAGPHLHRTNFAAVLRADLEVRYACV